MWSEGDAGQHGWDACTWQPAPSRLPERVQQAHLVWAKDKAASIRDKPKRVIDSDGGCIVSHTTEYT
jgi:hypothetical protein